jgi:prepilin-type N-terminal cleavage/methylation domain-containing protein
VSLRAFVNRSQRGLSLVEILVALTLISIGSLAAMTMQQQGTRSHQASYSREAAAALARQLLETVDSVSYTSPCLNDTSGSYVNPCPALGLATNPINAQGQSLATGGYTRQWQVSASGGTAPNTENYKTVRVRVTWNDRGATNQLTMTTVKSWAN